MSPLIVLAAGSLRPALTPLLAHYRAVTGLPVRVDFGPAGLLRQRIEAGAPCDLFASANTEHAARLRAQGLAFDVRPFARNRLCLTARRGARTDHADWLALLGNPELAIGTSTPGCDPSGDYAWQLFDTAASLLPAGAGDLKRRARPLVGGTDTLPVPAGELAAGWILRQGLADVFIGYAHYAAKLEQDPQLRVVAIPDEYNVFATYALALRSPRAGALADFILSAPGRHFLRKAGFLAIGDPIR
ncbi:substrate-binding domain-containing protein [Acerihabitans arboris]|uniref:Solute-binding protein n=1 Tax=Acerihabitans arboris TaxID=2691583 RepID=A0A845SEQ1_9GAMM|nr:substrate-binding domain-containing protein [Acerihabitans arboris]NDL63453.1 solute-binding protein [Acerihabitans arboris]